MAREEEDTPSYLDYGITAESSGVLVLSAFVRALAKHRRMSVSVTSIKDKTLAKKLAAEYPNEHADLSDYWAKTAPVECVHKFNLFYVNRHKIASHVLKAEDYGWDD